jgi:hypothetical protein
VDFTLLPYGAYVAFAFSCILFGGLAYRQVLDGLDLRNTKSGEDLESYISASGVFYAIVAALVLVLIGYLAYTSSKPSIWLYALPLVGLAQLVQLCMRLYFQRLRIRTRAIVVRYVLRSSARVIPYDLIRDVEFDRRTLWTQVTIATMHDEQATFRIFRASEHSFRRRVYTLSGIVASTQTE